MRLLRVLILVLTMVGAISSALGLSVEQNQAAKIISNLRSKSLASRINEASQSFFSKPYLRYPLGEGPDALFDQHPRYRFDGFDCTTFVETITALSLSQDLSDFEIFMDKIRYADAHISFESRNHFTDLDWIPNNTRAGLVSDITSVLYADLYTTAVTVIDKPNWYQMLSPERIHNSQEPTEKLINELHQLGQIFQPQESKIDYISIAHLTRNPMLLARIPNGSIVNFVRDNWNLKKFIGTNMNVSHQGFAIRKKSGELYFRHASSTLKVVTEEPMLGYLQRMLSEKSLSGINVLKIRPQIKD